MCLAALTRHSNSMVNEFMNHVQKQVFFLGAGGGGGGVGGPRGGGPGAGLQAGHGRCDRRHTLRRCFCVVVGPGSAGNDAAKAIYHTVDDPYL